MSYVYRFVDQHDKVIYVGYTGQTLDKRIAQHFDKGHLDKQCYKSIQRIEYKQFKTKADAQIMEVAYINYYKPIYNKLNKQNDSLTLDLKLDNNWKLYRIYKSSLEVKKVSILEKVVGWILFIAILLSLLGIF